jgi:hypothetical protein
MEIEPIMLRSDYDIYEYEIHDNLFNNAMASASGVSGSTGAIIIHEC